MAAPIFNKGLKVTAQIMRDFQQSSVAEVIGAGANVKRMSNQLVVEQQKDGYRNAVDFGTFSIVSEEADYIVCTAWNTVTSLAVGSTVNIAKPYLLRRTPFDGVTITFPNAQDIAYTYTENGTRTANDGTSSQSEILTPQYTVGELLIAFTGMSGGSGVTVSDSMLVWMDVNTGGRQWSAT